MCLGFFKQKKKKKIVTDQCPTGKREAKGLHLITVGDDKINESLRVDWMLCSRRAPQSVVIPALTFPRVVFNSFVTTRCLIFVILLFLPLSCQIFYLQIPRTFRISRGGSDACAVSKVKLKDPGAGNSPCGSEIATVVSCSQGP